MRRRTTLLLCTSATLATIGCSSAAPSGPAPQIVKASIARDSVAGTSKDTLASAVAANNAFAVDLYAHERAAFGSSNFLTSPISASLDLTMTYAGARGQTASEMAAALHLDSNASSIFDGQNALSQALASRGPTAFANAQQTAQEATVPAPSRDVYQLQVVNSVWGDRTLSVQPPFLTTLAKSYGTGLYLEDFVHQPEPARQVINAWVSSQTSDKINDLLPLQSIDASTRMVLVNAIHLKFPWATPFDVSATAMSTFHRVDGTTVPADFMNKTDALPYVDDGRAQIVALPLSDGQVVIEGHPSGAGLSVVIALPYAGVDLAAYETSLAAQSAALAQPSSNTLVQLSLPKVAFRSKTFSLTQALQAMGMVHAFDPNVANFTGISPGPGLYVSDVLQKTMAAFQETGVEAAAATAVTFAYTSAPSTPPTPTPMVVDRPYLVAIVDVPTGAILFLGHIVDPTDAGSP